MSFLDWLGRFIWYLIICSNPLTLALWIMSHVDHHQEEDK